MYWRVVWPRVKRSSRRQGVFFNSTNGCFAAHSSPMPAMINLRPAKIQMAKIPTSSPREDQSA